ncbi:hypothetical protein LZ198_13905 [Myxococcus sp. K15C18031901]|uniref:hypothetical protein n=1 Tax=Myxococcus dinghuensis TaxID=2906761 RepID=UPI0020A718D5|nr:hypothetical protein [Myxococcus dinghuensis]MCP3099965.1 hypothetical protein [Myxococcus dinghuensis]
MSPKTSALEPLRVRIRRFQFIVGLGFLALIGGSILSVSLTLRLSQRIQSLPFGALKTLMAVVLENLWVLVVLPVLCYGAARVMELKPWNTAAGSAVSGAGFVLALGFVQGGVDSLWFGGLGSVLNVLAFGVGVVICARAVMMGRAAAEMQSQKAQNKSEDRRSEYDEFLRAAEQGGARLEQREAAAAASASASVATGTGPSETSPAVETGKVDTAVGAVPDSRPMPDTGRIDVATAALLDVARDGKGGDASVEVREGTARLEAVPRTESSIAAEVLAAPQASTEQVSADAAQAQPNGADAPAEAPKSPGA